MNRKPTKGGAPRPIKGLVPMRPASDDFDEVVRLIEAARSRAFAAVNAELVGLYWQIGEYISRKIASAAWGEGAKG
jgi:hypothetical protein